MSWEWRAATAILWKPLDGKTRMGQKSDTKLLTDVLTLGFGKSVYSGIPGYTPSRWKDFPPLKLVLPKLYVPGPFYIPPKNENPKGLHLCVIAINVYHIRNENWKMLKDLFIHLKIICQHVNMNILLVETIIVFPNKSNIDKSAIGLHFCKYLLHLA